MQLLCSACSRRRCRIAHRPDAVPAASTHSRSYPSPKRQWEHVKGPDSIKNRNNGRSRRTQRQSHVLVLNFLRRFGGSCKRALLCCCVPPPTDRRIKGPASPALAQSAIPRTSCATPDAVAECIEFIKRSRLQESTASSSGSSSSASSSRSQKPSPSSSFRLVSPKSQQKP